MSCTPTPTATQYTTFTSYTTSTSYSQSAAAAVTTILQQSCIASGTISGSSVGCISSTQLNTVEGGQTAQVPILVTVPITETEPIQTLFAPCTGSSPTTTSTSQLDSTTPLTTSVLVQSTPPPSTLVESSSTTLSNGSVVQTVVTVVSAVPPTSIYVATTSLASPTLQSNSSQGSGTSVAPIIGGVLGGFFGLVVIVGSLWWLCRRRRSWDDIFEKELQNDIGGSSSVPVRRQRDRDSIAEPRPYEYGLVGRVIPPVAAGEPIRSSRYGSVSEHSGTHSRNTSYSATPLLQGTGMGSSRPSTAGSLTAHIQAVPRVKSSTSEPRSLSIVSSNSTRPLLDDSPSSPALLGNWTPNTDELAILEPLNRTGSPVAPAERRILQIVNDGPPSPTDTVVPDARRTSSRRSASSNVIVHTDGGRIPEESDRADPPAYTP